ncbi:PHD finger protein 20-like isoform X4 [Polyodon spathula]|uniref:PHD finger protein 20-like isoform X4 n=1 Tax=Polyodon spathula TaxID=7913 RepID=UPI001B7E4567|nr:PHD finger protein 20-like isoform X4 [Polyodon spathula]
MSKNPPNRRGIIFEVGAHLEARDTLKNCYNRAREFITSYRCRYAANIEKIDYEEEKVLIHYRQWSHRYDEWFEWSSPYLRPVERIQLRKEGLQEGEVQAEFRVNEKVLASWTDCRFYPARVLSVNRDLSSYTVKFYDGVVQAVKGIHVKPYCNEKSKGKSKIEDKQKGKVCDKEKSARGHKVREKLIDIKEQNSTPKSKKSKRNETENKRDASKEEDDRNVPVKGAVREESKRPKRGSTSDMVKEERKVSRVKTVDKKKTVEETKKKEEEKNVESGEETTEKNVTSAGQETRSKESKKEDDGLAEEKSQQPEETPMENKDAENSETEVEKQSEPEEKISETETKRAEGSGDGTGETGKDEDRGETTEQKGQAEEKKEKEIAETTVVSTEDREAAAELGDSKPADQSPNQALRKRGRPPSKAKSPDNQHGILELRKRKISLGTYVPSKRTKLDTNADTKKSSQTGSSDQDYSRRKSSRLPINDHGQHSIKSTPVPVDSKHMTLSDSKQKESAADTKKSSQTGSSDQDCSRRKSSRLSINDHGQHSIKSTPVPVDSKHMTLSDSKQKESAADQGESAEIESAVDSSGQSQEPSNAVPESPAPPSSEKQTQEEGAAPNETPTTALKAEPGKLHTETGKKQKSNYAPVVKRQPQPPNPNKYSREPLYTAIKRSQDSLSPKALTIDLDHTFKCKVPDCLKSFRKAKLLHYHMKYYHGEDKAAESEQSPTKRSIQTRASEKQAAMENPKRRRTISASLHIPLDSAHRNLPSSRTDSKVGKLHERRRTSVPPAVNTLHNHRPSLREKSKENQLEKSNRKQQEKEKDKGANDTVKEKEKVREKKHREFLRVKLKKKKKKKKKSKSEYTGSEENIDISRDFSPKKIFVQSKLNLPHKSPFSHKHKLLYNSSPGYTEKIKVDDEDTMSDSSTDSLLWSEDELGQDVDVTTNPDDDGLNEGRREFEIVRCICEVQEENDFMIQCEECLCWQHGVCMGLLEDNVPEKYTCYICRDPPGQRQSLKYWYDKDWLSNGHMYGLSFLEENYSHQNAKKIAATHQLLGDVHKVIEVLNGLQLKMSILQSQAHPDLKFRCPSWKQVDSKEKPRKRQATAAGLEEGEDKKISAAEKPCPIPSIPSIQESYIASEHCYQKPRTYYPAVEQRLVVETRGSELEERVRGVRETGEDLLALEQRYGRSPDQDRRKADWEPRLENEQDKEAEVSKRSFSGESCNVKVAREDRDGDMNFQQQWQINLMDHIEAVQDEVIHRMDFIEGELDVLESWLDYTGELEPPEPLARLPQLKHRIKQLLTELGKVQQIALCCST